MGKEKEKPSEITKQVVMEEKPETSKYSIQNRNMCALLVVVALAAVVVVCVTIAVIVAMVVLKREPNNHGNGNTMVVSDDHLAHIGSENASSHPGDRSQDSGDTGKSELQDFPLFPQPVPCRRTASDIIGPYYFPGAERTDFLCSHEPLSKLLHIQGYVYAEGCGQRVAGAKIEIWQAGVDGNYKENCRGHVISDQNGYFKFKTVRPGHYRVSEWSYVLRASHIHYRISHDDYGPLVTQQYFADDEHTVGQIPSLISNPTALDANNLEAGETVTVNFVL